jgi:hypothetical protein
LSRLDVLAFLDELTLLVLLAIAGASLPVATALRVVLAIVLPVAVAIVWGLLLAPRASRRLTGYTAIAVRTAVISFSAGLFGAAVSVVWAVVFWAVSIAIWSAVDHGAQRSSSVASAEPTNQRVS